MPMPNKSASTVLDSAENKVKVQVEELRGMPHNQQQN